MHELLDKDRRFNKIDLIYQDLYAKKCLEFIAGHLKTGNSSYNSKIIDIGVSTYSKYIFGFDK